MLRGIPLLLGLALCAGHARAQAPEPIRLVYTAFTADCPDADVFWQRVVARTAAARAREGEAAPEFRVVLAPEGERVQAAVEVVELDGTASRRTVVGTRCEDAASAAALVVALAIEERAQAHAIAPLPPPPPPPPPPSPPSPPPARAVLAPTRVWRFRIGAAFDVDLARAPDAVLGGALALGVRQEATDGSVVVGPAFRAALAASASAPVDVSGQSALFSWWTARLEGCPVSFALAPTPRLAPALHLEACALVDVGAIVGAGENVEAPRTAVRPWVALGLTARLSWRIAAGVGLELGGGFAVPLIRDRFLFASGTVVLQVPEVGAILDVGLSWTIP